MTAFRKAYKSTFIGLSHFFETHFNNKLISQESNLIQISY
jgi:hypothetical protein